MRLLHQCCLAGLAAFLGTAQPSQAFQFAADEFKGMLNGANVFLDNFDGSTTPPAAPKFLTDVPLTAKYNVLGTFATPSNGRLLFSNAQTVVSPSNPNYLVNRLTLAPTSATGAPYNPLQSGTGFEIAALFDLVIPQKNDEGYCLELGDWQANPKNDPSLWAKEVIRLCLHKNPDNGNVHIRFNKKDVSTGVATLISKVAVEPGHQQIRFKLTKADAARNIVTASYAYVDGGVAGNDVAMQGTASVFTFKQYTIPGLHAFTPVGTADTSGTTSKLTLQAHIQIGGDYLGKTGNLYVVVVIPSYGVYLHDGSNWVLWSGGTMPAYRSGVVLQDQDIPVLQDLDVRAFLGSQIYVGYGISDSDMLANGNYSLVNTIQ